MRFFSSRFRQIFIICFLIIFCSFSQTLYGQDNGESADEQNIPKPGKVLLRSAIVPGWGQWVNGKYIKSVGFFGVHAYFTYRFFEGQQQVRSANTAEEKEDLEYQRNTWAWRYLAAYLLNLTDAYVDAHLAGFPEDEFDVGFAPMRQGLQMNISISF